MRFVVLIGSLARGDYNFNSDCDLLIIGNANEELVSISPSLSHNRVVNTIHYSLEEFVDFYKKGSLFLYHCFTEGILIEGDRSLWDNFCSTFSVQRDYAVELRRISLATNLLSNTTIFGGKYLTPLVNGFTEIKNACIFYLAHNGIYEFNKDRCIEKAASGSPGLQTLLQLKFFYDYSVRDVSTNLPFDPNNKKECESTLREINVIVERFSHAC